MPVFKSLSSARREKSTAPSTIRGRVSAVRLLAAVTAASCLVGCVDLTEPWNQKATPTGTGGPGGGAGIEVGEGGTGGGDLDAAMGGSGGAIGSGLAGAGGGIDLGAGGTGGAIDPGSGGTGGAVDAPADIPIFGTGGGATGGTTNGTGGKATGGTTSGTGGKATGGTAGGAGGKATGGAGGKATGGATGGTGGKATGGTTSGTGGAGTGGATSPDAGLDAQPDASTLLNGLAVYYTFESATGTDLPDISGMGNTGTLSIGLPPDGGTAPSGPGYEFVAGKVGNGLTFHKAGLGYVRVPTAVFANATDLTLAVWVNTTTSQNWARILDVGVTPNPYQLGNTATVTKYLNLVPKNDVSNMLFSITTNGYGSEQKLSAANLSTDVWTHLAVVLASGAGGTLYVNGAAGTPNAALTLRPTDLGAIDYAFIAKSRFDADPALDGTIDEFRVYNRALSAAEITALYQFAGP